MQDALDPLEEEEYPTSLNRQLLTGLAVSLVLHLVCAALLLGIPGGGEPARPAVTYVDLNTIPAPVPAAPAVQPQPQPEPDPEQAEEEAEPLPPTPPPQQVQAAQPAAPAPQPAKTQTAAEERSHTTFGMGLTKGYFRTLSDGETLRPEIKEYYIRLLQGVNEKWWLEQKDQKVAPIVVNITITRSGEIIGSTILESSGNIVYDRAVQKTLESAGPLPPVPPDYIGDFFQAPVRLVPPLNLLSW
ncbi:TonB C-terminal domain-containing protein [Geomonas sp. Red69]|uniref:TonB C-terminal domain-containing protein n=1 Tax=Geomonas diazotrophica TaxID=2843197 RepID=A0ABX8JLA5_9BACT|nr:MULTISPECIES: energy transducer TonB [Geomonas]MBU5637701.1 TonB C-terminal domain-containing protein [Geomonas diazotrophica]QWV96240.1 TonB C-terminal domain-containing protein [Geomonas nitrogeniifigens]